MTLVSWLEALVVPGMLFTSICFCLQSVTFRVSDTINDNAMHTVEIRDAALYVSPPNHHAHTSWLLFLLLCTCERQYLCCRVSAESRAVAEAVLSQD